MAESANSIPNASSLNELSYSLIPMGGPQSRSLQNDVFRFWKEFWQDIFAKMGHPNEPHPEEYLRQSVLAVVTHREQPVAFHLYTFFDLDWAPILEHSYFETLTKETSDFLKSRAIRRVMTMEYLSVHPAWRKSQVGLPLGDVVIGLGQRFLMQSGRQAAIGTARIDVKVDRSTTNLGFIAMNESVKRYDYECRWVVSIAGENQPHPDESVNRLIDRLWLMRNDQTTQNPQLDIVATPIRKAA